MHKFDFINMREYTLGKRLLKGIYISLIAGLNRHSADLGKTILSEVQTLVFNGMHPLMELIAKGTVTIALIILLLIVDPKLALIIGASLAGAYWIIFYFVRIYLRRNGEKRLIHNQLRFKAVNEAFGASKEVKVGGLEETYIKSFAKSARIYARAFATQGVISQLPRFLLEAIGFGGILLMILYMMSQTGSFNNSLPRNQFICFCWLSFVTSITTNVFCFCTTDFVGPSIDKLNEDLKYLTPTSKNDEYIDLKFTKTISLKNIYYSYPQSKRTALKNITMKSLLNLLLDWLVRLVVVKQRL